MSLRRRIVLKFGTSTLTDADHSLSQEKMVELARQVSLLHQQEHSLVIVTSGAVAAGREVLPDRSKVGGTLPEKQMLSAIGQLRLMHTWSELFAVHNVLVGQVLLSRGDFANRSHYLNIRDTILELLDHGVVPIVNENDTVATKRLRFGDNDNLSALVANLVDADLLAFITDQAGLFTGDPRSDPHAELIPVVEKIDDAVLAVAQSSGSAVGTGGMITKIEAAALAIQSGTQTQIVSASEKDVLLRLAAGEPLGTRFLARATPLESRKRWLVSERPQGEVIIDEGAVLYLKEKGASLLPVGLSCMNGTFGRGAVIAVLSQAGDRIGTGMANYSSQELERIAGHRSTEIEAILGYTYGDEVIHRDNLAMKEW